MGTSTEQPTRHQRARTSLAVMALACSVLLAACGGGGSETAAGGTAAGNDAATHAGATSSGSGTGGTTASQGDSGTTGASANGTSGTSSGPASVPQIATQQGGLDEGSTVSLRGAGFSAKSDARPLLFWSADGGTAPSALGRKSAWDGAFNGQLVSSAMPGAAIAVGSTQALRHDFGSSEGAILARVSFASNQLYVWRKRYDDFDRATDYAIRTRYTHLTALSGLSALSVGMRMSTADKALWGQVIQLAAGSGVSGTAFYSNTVGNLTDYANTRQVANGSTLYFYAADDTALSTPLFQATLNEGSGIFQTFNHKIFRLWGKYGVANNTTYISLAHEGEAYGSQGALVSEQTQEATFWKPEWDHPIASAKRRWVIEEFQYQAGTQDHADGMLLFWQDRLLAWRDKRFRFTTSSYPMPYSDLYQDQVSNGAQPGSFEYFDTLYVDDSWHRVLLCDTPSWDACTRPEVQVPTSWSDTQLSFTVRRGGLGPVARLYVYVINAQGQVNPQGF